MVLDFIAKGEKLMLDENCPKFLEGHVKKLKEAADISSYFGSGDSTTRLKNPGPKGKGVNTWDLVINEVLYNYGKRKKAPANARRATSAPAAQAKASSAGATAERAA